LGSVNLGIPTSLAKLLVAEVDLRVAVESGTYLGASAMSLSRLCEEVWTIEASRSLFEQASERLSSFGNVRVVLGSSPTLLPSILRDINRPALFWLDGHWSGGPTAGDQYECPVLDEIRAIDEWNHADASCFLIDDARFFLGPPPPPNHPSEWPTFTEISDLLRRGADRYVTALDDVIIAVPSSHKRVVDSYWLPIAARHSELLSTRGRGGRVARGIGRIRRKIRAGISR
jgi:hypothetical protein